MEEVVRVEQPQEKKKRGFTDEQKQKMKEGRKAYWAARRKEKAEKAIAPEVMIPSTKIKVFGETDRNVAGKITSEFPSYYFEQIKQDLRNSIEADQSQLDQDAIPPAFKARFKEGLRRKKEKLEKIEADTPRLTGKEKDAVAKMNKEMAGQIREAHFTRSEREKGLADAHEEAHRMADPVMEIKSQDQAEFARSCGIQIRDGRVSRNDMERMYKISSKLLNLSGGNEHTDIEYLRRG